MFIYWVILLKVQACEMISQLLSRKVDIFCRPVFLYCHFFCIFFVAVFSFLFMLSLLLFLNLCASSSCQYFCGFQAIELIALVGTSSFA